MIRDPLRPMARLAVDGLRVLADDLWKYLSSPAPVDPETLAKFASRAAMLFAPVAVIREGDTADEWPILYRRDVPTLTDEQWYAAPEEEGWRKA